MPKFSPVTNVARDGLIIPEIGPWGLLKYRLVGAYCDIFSSAMKNKWDKLVYIDLFSGAGFANIRGTDQNVMTSPLISMNVPNPFDRYIFSEFKEQKSEALRARVKRLHPHKAVSFYQGDTNQNIDGICEEIRWLHERYRTLCFCFVDPFSLNLNFETVRKLSQFNIDFLILLAIHMDFNRNVGRYLLEHSQVVERFTANPNWREHLMEYPDRQNVINFLASEYDRNMLSLGYKKPPEKQQFRSDNRKLPLYHMAFYSRHELGNSFFKKIKHYGDSMQLSLF